MGSGVTDGESIGLNGWRQGSVVGAALAREIRDGGTVAQNRIFVVASQDCDVVHRSFETEPSVELIAGIETAEAPAAQLAYGKNPRLLHVAHLSGRLEFSITERLVVDRSLLARHEPAGRLDDASVRILALWLAKRYIRSAFPDTFNERVRPAAKKIERALKTYGKDASGIFVALNDWGELEAGQAYRGLIAVVFPVEVGDDNEREAGVAELAAKLLQALDGCEGIEIEDVRHIAEDEFTLHDLHTYKRWEFDFRSHSGRPGGAVSPAP